MKHLTLILTITSMASISSFGLSGCNNYRPVNPHGLHYVSTDTSSSHIDHNNTNLPHSQTTEHHAVWTYGAQTGPDFWGDMDGFEACKTGIEQSPIDIDKVSLSASNESFPKISFDVNDLVINDSGHSIVYTPQIDNNNNNNVTSINGDIYTLKQFHYHAPSEHEIAGISYPAELHFVHSNADNNLAVIGVLLQPELDNSLANPSLDKILAGSREAHLQGEAFLATQVDINKLLPPDTEYYHYAGSLTTPPCSEQVQWYVAKTPLTVSVAQLAVLKTLYEGNNRPTQPVGQRDIELFLK